MPTVLVCAVTSLTESGDRKHCDAHASHDRISVPVFTRLQFRSARQFAACLIVFCGCSAATAQNLSPTRINFASWVINTTSNAVPVMFQNSTGSPLVITRISTAGDFGQSSNCPIAPASLPAGGQCTIQVTFTPTFLGVHYGNVSISYAGAANGTRYVSLTGAGVLPVTFTPASLSFPSQNVNTTSAAQSIVLKNRQEVPLAISSIVSSGDFAQTSSCPILPSVLAKRAFCTIWVIFRPTTAGARTGSIVVVDDAWTSPQSVPLSGTGTSSGVVAITVTPLTPTIAKGQTQSFVATGKYSDNSTRDLTTTVTWNTTSPATATISSSGVATGTGVGATSITASLGSVTGSAILTVTPAALTSLAITPANASVSVDGRQQFTATGTYSDRTVQDVTSQVNWLSSNPAVATISATGLALGLTSGQATITADLDGVSGSAGLTVSNSGVSEFPLSPGAGPSAVCLGPDQAVWFTEEGGNKIGRITVDGTVTEIPVPTSNAGLGGITTGPDGNLYFTEFRSNKVGRWSPATRQITEWTLPQTGSGPGGILTGPDGNLWIMQSQTNSIVRMTTAGTFFPPFSIPTPGAWPHGPTLGPDGNVWFAELMANKIARITPDGQATEFPLPQWDSRPYVLTAASDGNIYFTEYQANKIGRISLRDFSITQWPLATGSQPLGIAAAPDGNIYFAERLGNKIGVMPVGGGAIQEYAIPTAGAAPNKVTVGPDGKAWFSEQKADSMGHLF